MDVKKFKNKNAYKQLALIIRKLLEIDRQNKSSIKILNHKIKELNYKIKNSNNPSLKKQLLIQLKTLMKKVK